MVTTNCTQNPSVASPETANLIAGTASSTPDERVARDVPRFHRPELDAIRFCAFALVFVHHVLGFENRLSRYLGQIGAFGMCLFFFLSSYLITELLQREKKATGRIHLKDFYFRRILRIWPLYFAFIALGVVIGKLHPSMALSNGLIASFLLMIGNWYVGKFFLPHSPVGILWSISLEEQFYLVWPFLQRSLSQKRMAVACLVLLPISSYYVWKLAGAGADVWVNTLAQSQFFAMGGLLALAMNSGVPQLGIVSRMLTILAGFGLWIFAVVGVGFQQVGTPSLHEVVGYILVACGCLLIVYGALGTPPTYLPKPIVYLGKISYGLYVFHGLCLSLAVAAFAWLGARSDFLRSNNWSVRAAKDLFALALTIAMAMLSYRYFEAPFLRWKERFTFIRSRGV
jgi:peptidoglycan/LPS O-acetylase OafA/YrhL